MSQSIETVESGKICPTGLGGPAIRETDVIVTDENEIVVGWRTRFEFPNSAFNILRSRSPKGNFVRQNDRMINGSGITSDQIMNYMWVDENANPGIRYYYKIEEVSRDGAELQEGVRIIGQLGVAGSARKKTWKQLYGISQPKRKRRR